MLSQRPNDAARWASELQRRVVERTRARPASNTIDGPLRHILARVQGRKGAQSSRGALERASQPVRDFTRKPALRLPATEHVRRRRREPLAPRRRPAETFVVDSRALPTSACCAGV